MKCCLKLFKSFSKLLVFIMLIVVLMPKNTFALSAPVKVTGLKVAGYSYNSLLITWGKVSGANGYSVYRSTSSNGSYSLVSTLSLSSYVSTNLTTGKSYYYKVRAYKLSGKVKIYGSYSSVIIGKPKPAVPSNLNASVISYNNIKVSWNTVGGASGYEVYRKMFGSASYSYLTTTTSQSYANNNLKDNTRYFYQIRSFRTVNGVKYYSDFTLPLNTITLVNLSGASINKGYVYNTDLIYDLKVRDSASLSGNILGYLYNFQKITILDIVKDSDNNVWDKILYNNTTAYVSDAYIQHFTSPPDSVVAVAQNITTQYEVGTSTQVAGNYDSQGLSLGRMQWCIGQGTLQPLLRRMDKQYNAEMKQIFGSNYNSIHSMLQGTLAEQMSWAMSINNSSNNIINPWNSQFKILASNTDFIKIEVDAQNYNIKMAMAICDSYNLKTVRGFALAYDIINQVGSINTGASEEISTMLAQNSSIDEKSLLSVIANAIYAHAPTNALDIYSRENTIINGDGTVHGISLNLDNSFNLSDNIWR